MKKNTLTLFIALMAVFTLTAQENKYRLFNYYEGYIINKDGEKERGYIRYIDEIDRYKKVYFKKEKDGKKQRFKVKDINGYKVAGKTYHAIKYKGVMFSQRNFLLLEDKGCINTYTIRTYNKGAWDTEMVLALNGNSVSTQSFILGFAKRMSEFVKDNPELSAKIKNKEKGYGLLNLQQIVKEYNANCKS